MAERRKAKIAAKPEWAKREEEYASDDLEEC